jgi:hypothetical protein
MDSGSGMSPADISALTGGNSGFGGSSMWIFAILILFLFSGNGFGFGARGYEPQYATQQDVQYTSQFGQLLDGNRDIINNITSGTAQAVAATNQAKYDNINVMKDVQMALASQIADVKSMEQNILGNQNECCCSTKMLVAETGAGINSNIAQNRYEAAMNTASINANTTAQTQKILDAIMGNRMADMQNQINQLQLQSAMCGVVKYPNATTYSAGGSPFCTGCGCN